MPRSLNQHSITQYQFNHHHVHLHVLYLSQNVSLLSPALVTNCDLFALRTKWYLPLLIFGFYPFVFIWLHSHHICIYSVYWSWTLRRVQVYHRHSVYYLRFSQVRLLSFWSSFLKRLWIDWSNRIIVARHA